MREALRQRACRSLSYINLSNEAKAALGVFNFFACSQTLKQQQKKCESAQSAQRAHSTEIDSSARLSHELLLHSAKHPRVFARASPLLLRRARNDSGATPTVSARLPRSRPRAAPRAPRNPPPLSSAQPDPRPPRFFCVRGCPRALAPRPPAPRPPPLPPALPRLPRFHPLLPSLWRRAHVKNPSESHWRSGMPVCPRLRGLFLAHMWWATRFHARPFTGPRAPRRPPFQKGGRREGAAPSEWLWAAALPAEPYQPAAPPAARRPFWRAAGRSNKGPRLKQARRHWRARPLRRCEYLTRLSPRGSPAAA